MSEKTHSVSRESSMKRKKGYSGYHYRRRSRAAIAEQYTPELQHVLGLTLKSNCAFTCDPNTGLLAYPAGCVIVLHNPRFQKQSHIFNPGQKTITCLRFSKDGNFIATGETGHQPCVRVFGVHDRCQVIAFSGHKFGISSVAFSPNAKYVVSIGYQHDNVINVWDWKKDKLAASNKVSTKVKSVGFAEDSSYFVTVGNRHVKFWYLENPSADKTTVPLKGRSAILDTLRNHIFCDVVCGTGSESNLTFAVTKSGILCQFNAGRTVEKYVELQCGTARTVCSMDDMILCGCASGSVHVFNSSSLEFVAEIFPPDQVRNHEVVATTIDVRNMWMHCVFSDHSLLVFDVMDFSNPYIHSLFQFHNSCVWDIKVIPPTSECESLPKDCFLTCSIDGTARAWHCQDKYCELCKVIKLEEFAEKGSEESGTKFEARSLCIRFDAKHLAVGDRAGNIHVFSLESFEKLAFIPTHAADVLCIDYSSTGRMLASASRDRCVHTFGDGYVPTHTIADHSAAVTSVKFAHHGNDFRLVTCGADKSLYFCSITDNNGKTEISRDQHFVEKHSMSDMAVLEESVLVACGVTLSEYDIIEGKLKRSFRANDSTAAIFRIAVDGNRTIVATSCADKHIYILSYTAGDCLCVLSGHSEVAMALTFDLENRLLSASADSCVFVWTLNHRTAEDLNHLQAVAAAASAASTPDGTDLNKTDYFGEVVPAELTYGSGDDQKCTPRILNGESLPALFHHNADSEDADKVTFEAYRADPVVTTPKSLVLPKWVTRQLLPGDNALLDDHTPRPSLGKWGNKLELDKICEEIDNLAQSVDVMSIVSSRGELPSDDDDDDDASPSDDELSVEEQQFALKDIQPNADLPSIPVVSHEHEETEQGLILQEPSNQAVNSMTSSSPREEVIPDPEMKPSYKEDKDLSIIEELREHPEDGGNDHFNRELTEISPIDRPNSLSLQDEINVILNTANTQGPELYNDDDEASESLVTLHVASCDVSLLPGPTPNKPDLIGLNQNEPPADRDMLIEDCLEEEEIDVRKVFYVATTNSETKPVERIIVDETASKAIDNTQQEGTKKSSFVSAVTFHLNASPRSNSETQPPGITLPLCDHNNDTKSTISSQIIDNEINKTCHELVDEVLTSVESFSDSDSDATEQQDIINDDDQQYVTSYATESDPTINNAGDISLTEQNIQNENMLNCATDDNTQPLGDFAGSGTSQPRDEQCSNISEEGDEEQCSNISEEGDEDNRKENQQTMSEPSQRLVPSDFSESCAISEQNVGENDRNKTFASQEKTSAMPPAFAELLASLTKKRSPRVSPLTSAGSLGVRKTYRSEEENMSRINRPHKQNTDRFESGNHLRTYEETESFNSLERNNNYCDNTQSGDAPNDEWCSEQVDCQRVSENLLAVFNQAEVAYRKQKTYCGSDPDVINGNKSGFHKLVRVFQSIHARIGKMSVNNTVVPEAKGEETLPRALSLNNLRDDSPVYSLLREYSDRLVDIVHTQVDNKSILKTQQADTV